MRFVETLLAYVAHDTRAIIGHALAIAYVVGIRTYARRVRS